MSEPHPTAPAPGGQPRKPVRTKPDKPYPEFPLTAHPAGYWCKKIGGKLFYFGPWEDPQGALKKYLDQRDDLFAGRTPARGEEDGAVTVKDVANAFLASRERRRDKGQLSPRTLADYEKLMREMCEGLGARRDANQLGPRDFTALKTRLEEKNGTARVSVMVQMIRCAFKYAADSDLLPRPARFGPEFRPARASEMRKIRARQGKKLFTAAEARALAEGALVVGKDGPVLVRPGPVLRTMILLGLNGGFGNHDCGSLPLSAVDLDAGVIDYPRPKTGIGRRCVLWPETVAALREALAKRPAPKDAAHAGLVFLTARGAPWSKTIRSGCLTMEMRKLLDKLGINGHRNFYTLRHTFRTVADAAKDQPAADYVMGHEVAHMSSVYRETIADERLRAVADHVRGWLFGNAVK
jgi:integrase